MLPRSIFLAIVLTGALSAQMPKGFYAWWSSPIVKDLNLTAVQKQQIRSTVLQYRPRLIDIRAAVAKAEIDLEAQFDHDPVDATKANQAIEHVIATRSDLTRTLSQMSLKLRTVLTEQQWVELQRRRPARAPSEPATEAAPPK